jgi:hypothetical protein
MQLQLKQLVDYYKDNYEQVLNILHSEVNTLKSKLGTVQHMYSLSHDLYEQPEQTTKMTAQQRITRL